ncbi:MAG: ergothioneine biosynthesis protein EgtB [Cyanobacteria bacterium Co-bin8]|nr:ergothioneine biosynthesis protein EgtB [Cyanobacteria bacterium Co-bin8]
MRQSLQTQYQACRASTLALSATLTDDEYYRQAHPDFSPIGWHLGHIAFTESLWILEHLAGQTAPCPQYRRLFAADGLPKAEREHLPSLPVVQEYLAAVRQRVETYLNSAPLEQQQRLWCWLLQHESQHAETISMVLALHRLGKNRLPGTDGALQPRSAGESPERARSFSPAASPTAPGPNDSLSVFFPATDLAMGYDGCDAIDNEQPIQQVQIDAFWLDAYLVTVAEYRQFMQAGGYENSAWWSREGWAWLQANPVRQPLYWSEDSACEAHPVCGVSGFEADAYARFVGKRLPTEAEWELAARSKPHSLDQSLYPWGEAWPTAHHCNHHLQIGGTSPVGAYPAGSSAAGCYDLLGNVWEWTSSWFEGYSGFSAFPYRGYSEAYFDRQHRVLRGGSWATFPWALRGSFRNWYQPEVRQVFAGFRCARSEVTS